MKDLYLIMIECIDSRLRGNDDVFYTYEIYNFVKLHQDILLNM